MFEAEAPMVLSEEDLWDLIRNMGGYRMGLGRVSRVRASRVS